MSKQIPKDLAKIVLDTHNWHNKKSIKEFKAWELREALSYSMDLKIFLSTEETNTVQDQVQQLLIGVETIKFGNDILTQALIQQSLRQRGIEIKCFELDKFPKTSKELLPLLEKSKKSLVLTHYYKLERWLKSSLFVIMALVVVVYNLFFFDPALLLTGFLIAYFLHFILQIIEHEYWNHQYIIPKNKYLEKVFKFILYFSLGDIEVKRASHLHHHYYWGTKKDHLNTLILSSKYGHLFGTEKDAVNSDYILWQRMVEKGHKKLEKENKLSRFASKNQILLLALLCVLSVIVFGLPVMINIFFVSIVWHQIWGAMPDVAFYIAGKRENFPWLWPLMLRDAWHKSHHLKYKVTDFEKIEDLFPGPKWLKFISFEYYLIKGFFKFNN